MDRIYSRIVAALDEHLDPEVFESCVCDLLRDAFPGLVPIRGGDDAGMDGAIADGEGEAYPLVCTIAKDVIGNLTRSLDSYLSMGGRRRRVVLATSRALTPRRRRNLEKPTREKGFTLVQVVEREGIAQRLRWSPHWCRELGIPWTPSVLSQVPKTRRPLLEIEPVGRAADLEWLRASRGDRMLSGQPGSGKTFLLYQLVKEGWGLFLVDDDREAIAKALAEEKPPVVVVDDAHVRLPVLDVLRQLREEVGHPFDIVATTWEGERDRVVEAMGDRAPEQVHQLELLTREEILEVYRAAGVEAASPELKELIDQAANRPGLAVTLATVWQRGGWEEIRQGAVLRSNLLTIFRDLVGEEAETILGAFALGGDRGMQIEAVAEFLGLGLSTVWEKVTGLAAGGVLADVDQSTLAVWPRPLRACLLGTVFFPVSGPRLDYRPLFDRAPNKPSAVEALVQAIRRGAVVPSEDLHQLVEQFGKLGAWRELALVGPDEARWVLAHYPGDLEDVSRNAIQTAPEAVVPLMLDRAETRRRGPAVLGVPSTAPQILAEWILQTGVPAEALRRRRLLADEAKRHLAGGGERQAALKALCLAISPRWEEKEDDPADDRKGTLSRGLPTLETVRQCPALWQEMRDTVIDLLAGNEAPSWQIFKGVLWQWIYPEYGFPRSARDTPPELRTAMTAFAGQVLHDLSPLAADSPGLAAALKDLAERAGTGLAPPTDPTFDLLYPSPNLEFEELEERGSLRREPLEALATVWSREAATEVAGKLARYEAESARVGFGRWRRTGALCGHLALQVENPSFWLEQLVEEALPPETVVLFMVESLRRKDSLWEKTLLAALDSERYSYAATAVLLQADDLPDHLLQTAKLSEKAVENLCLQKDLPLHRLRLLLQQSDPDVILAAAFGEWYSDPQGQVRTELAGAWRRAILNASPAPGATYLSNLSAEYWLETILTNDPALAFDWLRRHLTACAQGEMSLTLAFSAVNALDQQQRLALLEQIKPHPRLWEILPKLVGTDLALFRHLLRREALRPYHLAPLQGGPNPEWVEMARSAMAAGYDPAEVVSAAFGATEARLRAWEHQGDAFWERWSADFAALAEDPRPEVREIARYGQEVGVVRVVRSGRH